MTQIQNCPFCGKEIDLEDKEEGEFFPCPDCQTKLVVEIEGQEKKLVQAPQIEEDWGE